MSTTVPAEDPNASDARRLDGARARLMRACQDSADFNPGANGDAVWACARTGKAPTDLVGLLTLRAALRARLRRAYAANGNALAVGHPRAAVEAIGAVFAWMEEP